MSNAHYALQCATSTLFIQIRFAMYGAETLLIQIRFTMCGTWNDTKHRPIVCLIKSSENENLYWAIPMGKLNHRNSAQKKRLDFYLNLPERDIRSCYYHTGRTTSQSIFFISDAIPITDKYIDGIHVGADKQHFIIKNPKLIFSRNWKNPTNLTTIRLVGFSKYIFTTSRLHVPQK